MANQKAYVLDRARALVPPGIAGELFLGGDGVGWDYHRQPRMSAARFIPDRQSFAL
jgi:non-ribosomal peptide synthetase component F